MKPVEFPEHNVVYAKDQPEYLPLPAYCDEGPEGIVITCWELSEEELKTLKETGKVWLRQFTFQTALQPVMLSVDKSDMFVDPEAVQEVVDNALNSFEPKQRVRVTPEDTREPFEGTVVEEKKHSFMVLVDGGETPENWSKKVCEILPK